jgi:hypothetical protein
MEFLMGPDSRFATPEKTMETYRAALIEGDLEAALECHIASKRKFYRKVYTTGGKVLMKRVAEDMKEIKKVSEGAGYETYQILRMEKGKKYSYQLKLYKRGDDWKIDRF